MSGPKRRIFSGFLIEILKRVVRRLHSKFMKNCFQRPLKQRQLFPFRILLNSFSWKTNYSTAVFVSLFLCPCLLSIVSALHSLLLSFYNSRNGYGYGYNYKHNKHEGKCMWINAFVHSFIHTSPFVRFYSFRSSISSEASPGNNFGSFHWTRMVAERVGDRFCDCIWKK